jgi:hypothetical protein
MKSIYHGKAAANCKLRGKKYHLLSCKCCCLINIKDEVREKEKSKEVREFLSGDT